VIESYEELVAVVDVPEVKVVVEIAKKRGVSFLTFVGRIMTMQRCADGRVAPHRAA
jgi:hypothetical protein